MSILMGIRNLKGFSIFRTAFCHDGRSSNLRCENSSLIEYLIKLLCYLENTF